MAKNKGAQPDETADASAPTEVEKIEGEADRVFHKDVAPWVKSLCATMAHDEVATLLPMVRDAAQRVEAQLANHDAGNPLAYADAIAAIIRDTAIQCAEAGIEVAGSSILAAVVTSIAGQKEAAAPDAAPEPAAPDEEPKS